MAPVDLPLDVQVTSERGLPWAFVDEARDPAVVVPGAYLVAGDDTEPVLVRGAEVDASGRAHVELVGGCPFILAALNFEAGETDVVLARPPAGAIPPVGAFMVAGTRAAWSWAQVQVQVQTVPNGWLELRLVGRSPDSSQT